MLQDAESLRLTGTQHSFTEPEIRDWLESLNARGDRADWAIIRREDRQYLGEVVLADHDDDNRSIGFRIGLAGSAYFGRGYGTEATAAVVAHAFLAMAVHRIELEVFSFNPRARRVYEKVGFVTEGIRREVLRVGDEWVDSIMMSIIASDELPG
jgi:RimJ/RimL family protein N-acetyltransferase